MLRILMANVDRAVEKGALRQSVFADDANVQADAVEVVMHRLRKKLVGTSIEIITLRGVGYLLCDSGSVAARRSGAER
jgi:two-component system response regulator TctD